MRKPVMFAVSCLAGIIGQFCLAPSSAGAAYRRVTGTNCSVDKQSYNLVRVNSAGIVNEAATNNQLYTTCTIPDDEWFPHHTISGINVHGNDGTSGGYVLATACVTYYWAFGGICGNSVSTSNAFTGMYTLQPPVAKLQENPWDFPHLFAMMSGYSSSVGGMYVY